MTTTILVGDALETLKTLPDESVQCCITSPPYYGLRDYGVDGQMGLEATPEQFLANMVKVFREVRRVLRADGTCWVNLGDSYATGTTASRQQSTGKLAHHTAQDINRVGTPSGLKTKDLVGIPWRFALALQADGWWLRSDIIWAKPNPMPESVTDRPTKAHEYIFLLTKSARYFYDAEAVRENRSDNPSSINRAQYPVGKPVGQTALMGNGTYGQSGKTKWDNSTPGGRNRRTVWTIATQPYSAAHFATFPTTLVEPMIKAGCPEGSTVLDPFAGAGTVGLVADRLNRDSILIELNPEYAEMARKRIKDDAGWLADVEVKADEPQQMELI